MSGVERLRRTLGELLALEGHDIADEVRELHKGAWRLRVARRMELLGRWLAR